MYDVSGRTRAARRARDGWHRRRGAATNLEDLVAAARQQTGNDVAMPGWVRPFSELPIERLTG
jgi:hypothetical protein